MSDWIIDEAGLKRYPHFDQVLQPPDISRLVENPEMVARHAFHPFILYFDKYTKFRSGGERKKKVRPIRIAARSDAYIYARYRHQLQEKYEQILREQGLSDCVVAYRKIPERPGSRRGKCNIHFANEVFAKVREFDRCCAVTADISSYFDNIDHDLLKAMWGRLIGETILPADHFAVFKNVTQYSDVPRDELYVRLGYKKRSENGSLCSTGKRIPIQLCSGEKLRDEICKSRPGSPSLVKKNPSPHGIPQGSPISDVLANVYLLDFDQEMQRYVDEKGGYYRRYSDDILIILPGDGRSGKGALKCIQNRIVKYGAQLKIKAAKTSVVCFSRSGSKQKSRYVDGGSYVDGLEYLGFRFDGRKVFLRNSTISNVRRRMRLAVRAEAKKLLARYQGKDEEFLLKKFDAPRFMQKFGRVDFDPEAEKQKLTFWSYIRRTESVMGSKAEPIYRQVRKHRALVDKWIRDELRR